MVEAGGDLVDGGGGGEGEGGEGGEGLAGRLGSSQNGESVYRGRARGGVILFGKDHKQGGQSARKQLNVISIKPSGETLKTFNREGPRQTEAVSGRPLLFSSGGRHGRDHAGESLPVPEEQAGARAGGEGRDGGLVVERHGGRREGGREEGGRESWEVGAGGKLYGEEEEERESREKRASLNGK